MRVEKIEAPLQVEVPEDITRFREAARRLQVTRPRLLQLVDEGKLETWVHPITRDVYVRGRSINRLIREAMNGNADQPPQSDTSVKRTKRLP